MDENEYEKVLSLLREAMVFVQILSNDDHSGLTERQIEYFSATAEEKIAESLGIFHFITGAHK